MYRHLHGPFNHIKDLCNRMRWFLIQINTNECFEEFLVGFVDPVGNSRIPDDKNVPSVKIVCMPKSSPATLLVSICSGPIAITTPDKLHQKYKCLHRSVSFRVS